MNTLPYKNTSYNFTHREVQVIQLIIDEHSSAEIAGILHLSPETIKTYRTSIRKKLDVRNVAGLVRKVILQRLVPLYTEPTYTQYAS